MPAPGSSKGFNIFTMNPDGSEAIMLTEGGGFGPSWEALPGPKRSDYKNASTFCKAEREFFGEDAFRERYGGGANAHGKCVSRN
jgi:hypothetical protein